MIKTIFKYPIEIIGEQDVEMPVGSEIISVHEQYDKLCLWAMVRPGTPIEKKKIYVRGTGHEFEWFNTHRFIGTVVTSGGALVWHVFEA